MKITLRPYQLQALESIASNLSNGIGRQIIHLPMAAGKTIIFSSLISNTIKVDCTTRALILAFSCDLLVQACAKLYMVAPGLDIGILDANNKGFDRQVVVSSIQSAREPVKLEKLQAQKFSINRL